MISFPLYGIVGEQTLSCACGEVLCKSPGKHPRVSNFQTLTESIPTADGDNVGILCGIRSNIVVLDDDTLTEKPLWDTLTVRTGRGRHYYFAYPGFAVRNSTKHVSSTIDVKSDGGYVLAPGSKHISGAIYTIENDREPAELPDLPGLQYTREERKTYRIEPLPKDHKEYERRVFLGKSHAKTALPSVQGDNGSKRLFAVACHLVRTLELPVSVAQGIICSIYNPRCTPEWTGKEIQHKLEDAATKAPEPAFGYPSEDFELALQAHKPSTAGKYVALSALPETFADGQSGKLAQLTRHFIDAEWKWEYNEFADNIFIKEPPIRLDAQTQGLSDRDLGKIRIWLDYIRPSAKLDIVDAIVSIASENSVHPVREYFKGLRDRNLGEDPAIAALVALMGAESQPLASVYVRKWLVAAVKRVMEPGCKFDNVLVLQGKQGVGKSTWGRVLFDPWFSDSMPVDFSDKDSMVALRGNWCMEIAELSSMRKSTLEATKAFLSRSVDKFRAPYERRASEHTRQCVFLGTTNDSAFLHDASGNRRFWTVQITKTMRAKDIATLKDFVWAEAMKLYMSKEETWLSPEESEVQDEHNRSFMAPDGWEEKIVQFCAGRVRLEDSEMPKLYEFVISDSVHALEKYNATIRQRLRDVLLRLRLEKTDGGWTVPESISTLPQKKTVQGANAHAGIVARIK